MWEYLFNDLSESQIYYTKKIVALNYTGGRQEPGYVNYLDTWLGRLYWKDLKWTLLFWGSDTYIVYYEEWDVHGNKETESSHTIENGGYYLDVRTIHNPTIKFNAYAVRKMLSLVIHDFGEYIGAK